MPPREEQIAQIDAALRRRFFSLVPKVVIEGRESSLTGGGEALHPYLAHPHHF